MLCIHRIHDADHGAWHLRFDRVLRSHDRGLLMDAVQQSELIDMTLWLIAAWTIGTIIHHLLKRKRKG